MINGTLAQADVRKGSVEPGAKCARDAIEIATKQLASMRTDSARSSTLTGFDASINRPLLGSAPMRKVHFDTFPEVRSAHVCMITTDVPQSCARAPHPGPCETGRFPRDSGRRLHDAAVVLACRSSILAQASFQRLAKCDRALAHGCKRTHATQPRVALTSYDDPRHGQMNLYVDELLLGRLLFHDVVRDTMVDDGVAAVVLSSRAGSDFVHHVIKVCRARERHARTSLMPSCSWLCVLAAGVRFAATVHAQSQSAARAARAHLP